MIISLIYLTTKRLQYIINILLYNYILMRLGKQGFDPTKNESSGFRVAPLVANK